MFAFLCRCLYITNVGLFLAITSVTPEIIFRNSFEETYKDSTNIITVSIEDSINNNSTNSSTYSNSNSNFFHAEDTKNTNTNNT